MATKSKNTNKNISNFFYNKVVKTISLIIALISFILFFTSVYIFFEKDGYENYSSFYDSYEFNDYYATYTHNITELYTKLISVKHIEKTFDSPEKYLERYETIINKLENNVNFVYCVVNTDTNKILTNVTDEENPIDYIMNLQTGLHCTSSTKYQPRLGYLYLDIKNMLSAAPYEIYVGVKDPIVSGDIFYDIYLEYEYTKNVLNIVKYIILYSSILLIISVLHLIIVSGKSSKEQEVKLKYIDKIPPDLHTIAMLFLAFVSMAIYVNNLYRYLDLSNYTIYLIFSTIILGIDFIFGINYLLSLSRLIKSKKVFKSTLIYILFTKFIHIFNSTIKILLNYKFFKFTTIVFLLFYGVLNGIIIFASLIGNEVTFFLGFLLFIFFNGYSVYIYLKSLASLSKIMIAAREISNGNIDFELDTKDMSIAFTEFSNNILNIQKGLKNAVENAIKGERMKTELITNVSHDLKTPLTSIITYVDLLKNEDLENEKALEYINILEDKSGRLKRLIDDLVQASKASTGNLAVSKDKIDLDELIMQAYGEYEDDLNNKNLEIIINSNDEHTYIIGDGNHLWRIIDNLISNALKYSLPNTRIYFDIFSNKEYGIMTIKNISANPLNISPDKLTERFVRGDESRSTEGSGLGLSIAQSLTTLQGGDFTIDIDGDLFKVTVKLPLWN